MENEKKKIDESCVIFKEVLNDSKGTTKELKFKNLGYGIKGLAKYFKEEMDNVNRPFETFHKYKRGAIVYVDFGTNVGGELSGGHFAIVLDKEDNPYKSTVTVIPLSSKNKNGRLSVGTLISKTVSPFLQKAFDEIKEAISGMKQDDDLTKIFKNLDKMGSVLSKYNSKNNISYIVTDQITTISKYKILKPINKYDPIGKMKVPNEVLDKIDADLIEKFTKSK